MIFASRSVHPVKLITFWFHFLVAYAPAYSIWQKVKPKSNIPLYVCFISLLLTKMKWKNIISLIFKTWLINYFSR